MKIKNIFLSVSLVLASLPLWNCSYVVDAIEGAITERASFSISAEFDGSNTVTIYWSESGGSNFAGYEIYMTDEVNDEYAGYVIAAGPYSDINGPGGLYNLTYGPDIAALSTSTTTSQQIDVTNVKSNNVTGYSMGKGIYFFRLGIIDWDDDEEDRTTENGYNLAGATWDDSNDSENNYNEHTNLGEISGYAMVEIF